MIEKLHYITQETETLSHIDCVKEACISGVKWIQLRVKNKTHEEYLAIAKEAKIICDLYEVVLIINDNIEVVKQIDAHGVHIGKTDMNPSEARIILGENKIIGGTANTIEEIEKIIDDVDYIGVGPFQYTETKSDLTSFLGLEGYEEIINKLKSKYTINETPIIAIGGVDIEDIEPLLETGIYGIAVSSLISKDFSKVNEVMYLLQNKQELC